MTKQEVIREETRNILQRYGNFMDGNCMADDDLDIDEALEAVFSYLHSQDVGIKGQCLGASHPHLSAYYTIDPLITK